MDTIEVAEIHEVERGGNRYGRRQVDAVAETGHITVLGAEPQPGLFEVVTEFPEWNRQAALDENLAGGALSGLGRRDGRPEAQHHDQYGQTREQNRIRDDSQVHFLQTGFQIQGLSFPASGSRMAKGPGIIVSTGRFFNPPKSS